MAVIRLVPSTYYLSNSNYLSVSNANNMYNNTDNDTYATVTNSRTSTSNYYIYLRGFNFDDVPAAAQVQSFRILLKARESGVNTSSSYKPYLADGTSAINGTCDAITTTITVHEFDGLSAGWETLSGYGSDLGIRINCRRASRNTTSYMYIYGAEIEVTYIIPDPRTITTSVSGSGTIDPSGTTTMYDGDEFSLIIEPQSSTAEVTATRDGTDITSSLVHHNAGSATASTVLGEYTLVSGSFNSGESYFEGIVGNGEDASTTSSNYYSSSSSVRAIFTYDMSITDIPDDAVITNVYVKVSGHAESTSNSNEYMCAQLISGDTELTEELNFKSVGTSNSVQTLEMTTTPTVAQLANMKLQCTLGYYGGAINGATVYVEYETVNVYYTYDFVVSGDTSIVVTIGSSSAILYFKNDSSWVQVTKVYKKISGAWVEQSDVTSIFNSSNHYIRG